MTEPAGEAAGAPRVLVIGCGSELRTDDAVGRRVAERVDAMDLEHVVVRSVVQLVPELALDVADADRVIIVDADVDAPAIVARRVGRAEAARGSLTHHVTPESLLDLAAAVGGGPDAIDVVSVPVGDLSVGDGLTERARDESDCAFVLVVGMITAPWP